METNNINSRAPQCNSRRHMSESTLPREMLRRPLDAGAFRETILISKLHPKFQNFEYFILKKVETELMSILGRPDFAGALESGTRVNRSCIRFA